LRKKAVPRVVLLGGYCDVLPDDERWARRHDELAREVQDVRALRKALARLREEAMDPILTLGSLAPQYRTDTMLRVQRLIAS
jgi:hypothetical protein